MLDKLPKTFYQQFKEESTVGIFGDIPFFRSLPLSKLREISMKIEKKLTHPEEIVIQFNTVPDILIANNGRIALTMNRVGSSTHGKEIQAFDIGGDEYKMLSMYFFANKKVNYDVVCKKYTIIYSLKQEALQELLLTNPYCYELYCMNRDKDKCNENDLEIMSCELCRETKAHHTLFECPKLHFMPIRNMLILKTLSKDPTKIKRVMNSKKRKREPRPTYKPLKLYVTELDGEFGRHYLSFTTNGFKRLVEEEAMELGLSSREQCRKTVVWSEKLRNIQQLSMTAIVERMGEHIRDEVIKNSFVTGGFD